MEMDYELLARQLIRALRGSRSQTSLSRRLRYKSNVLYSWEAGLRAPTAADFFRLCSRVDVDLGRGVAEFLGGVPDPLKSADWKEPATAAAFLSHLRRGTTSVELARRMATNRVSVARWLHGEAEPRLPEFLAAVDAASLRLLDFLRIFVDPASLPVARAAWEELQSQRAVAYEHPWSHAVLRVLELEDYRRLPEHQHGWIARRLGLSSFEEQSCLLALARSRTIALRKKKWVAVRTLTVDTRQNPDAGRALKQHWAAQALARLPHLEPNGEDLFSYNLFTLSHADWQKVRELHIAYYQELRRVIEKSTPMDHVCLVNVQLLRLDETFPGQSTRR